jgi:hypothetical protein
MYVLSRAVVVVEGATVASFVAETAAMLVVGLMVSMFGIGLFCWLIFTIAVYAVPFFVGLTAGSAAFHGGAGVIGALLVGIVAGAVTLATGQIAFAVVRPPILRAAIAAAFAVPAAIASYHAALGLSQAAVPSLIWRDVFAWVGAIFTRSSSAAWPGLGSLPCRSRSRCGLPARRGTSLSRLSQQRHVGSALASSIKVLRQSDVDGSRPQVKRREGTRPSSETSSAIMPSCRTFGSARTCGWSFGGDHAPATIAAFSALWPRSPRLISPTSCPARPASAMSSPERALRRTDAPGLLMA